MDGLIPGSGVWDILHICDVTSYHIRQKQDSLGLADLASSIA